VRSPPGGMPSAAQPVELPLGRTIVSGTAWSGVGRIAVFGFGFIGQVLTARLLTPRDFGSYTIILSVAAFVALVCQLGLPQSVVRHVARANAAPEGNQVRGAIVTSATLSLAAAAASGVLVLWPVGPLVARAFRDVPILAVLGALAAVTAFRVLENITPELFRAVRDFRGGSMFGGVLYAVLLAGFSAAVFFWAGTVSLEDALLISIGASAVSFALASLTLVSKHRALPRSSGHRLLDVSLVDPAIWFAAILMHLIAQLDLWVVGALGDAREIALYSAAFRLSMLVSMPLMIVNFVIPPLVVELLARDQPRRLERAAQTVATVAGLPAVIALIVFMVFGDWVCALVFGDFYRGAGVPLALLSVGKLAGVLAGACGTALIMSGGQRTNLWIMAINAAMTLPMQLAGYRWGGLAGVAAATSIGFALQNVHQVIAVRRRIGVRTWFDFVQTLRLIREQANRGSLRTLLIPSREDTRHAGE
jgi:O-antigen/teichoic acid export membrane protein